MDDLPTGADRSSGRRLGESLGPLLIVVTLGVLAFGILAGLGGETWGKFLAYGAFGAFCVFTMLGERIGWRRADRRRRCRRVPRLRRFARRSTREPACTATRSQLDRIRTEPPDFHERAGMWLLVLILVAVLGGGVVWVLMFLLGR